MKFQKYHWTYRSFHNKRSTSLNDKMSSLCSVPLCNVSISLRFALCSLHFSLSFCLFFSICLFTQIWVTYYNNILLFFDQRVAAHPGILLQWFFFSALKVIKHKPYDHKADVFSLGIVLWELLIGKVCLCISSF